jgi:hypothetical protein
MKNYFLAFTFLFVINANASIEFSPEQAAQPTEAELTKSRSCWEELNTLGCGDPGDDPQHFRSCLKDVTGSLTPSCKSMMKELYGN